MDQATPNDPQEKPTDLPPNASHFRIRHLTGRKGPPALVLDGDEPVTLPLDATMEDMRAVLPPGRYRLEVCDEAAKPLGVNVSVDLRDEEDDEEETASPPAPPPPAPPAEVADPNAPTTALLLRDALATLRASNESLTETIGGIARAMASAFGPVQPTPETITTAPIAVATPNGAPAASGSGYELLGKLLEHFGPMLPVILGKMAGFGGPPPPPSGAAPGGAP